MFFWGAYHIHKKQQVILGLHKIFNTVNRKTSECLLYIFGFCKSFYYSKSWHIIKKARVLWSKMHPTEMVFKSYTQNKEQCTQIKWNISDFQTILFGVHGLLL